MAHNVQAKVRIENAGMNVSKSFLINSERWQSGRMRTPGKCVYVNSVSGVRIPLSPPDK